MIFEITHVYIILAVLFIAASSSSIAKKYVNLLRFFLLAFSTSWMLYMVFTYGYALKNPFERYMFEQRFSGSYSWSAWIMVLSFGVLPQFLWVPKIHSHVGSRITVCVLSIIYPILELGTFLCYQIAS